MMTEELVSELSKRGYTYRNHGKCRACKSVILWFAVPNKKKNQAFNENNLQPHWETCSDLAVYRFKKELAKRNRVS